jgi:replicative DNA helicase
MSVVEQLISKVIDDNNVAALDIHGITRDLFLTDAERKFNDYVRKYAEENKGSAPSYVTMTANCTEFTYMPEISDSYEYLSRKLKESYGKRMLGEFLSDSSGKISAMYEDIGKGTSIDEFILLYTKRMEDITMRTSVRQSTGIDIAESGDKFLLEYEARSTGNSHRIWPSKFPSINEAIGGGYFSSNMYVVFARSGRGKSVLTMEEAIEFASQGATVLVWSLEMGWFEWMARAFTSISGRAGVTNATIDGVDYTAGFDNRAIQSATLSEEYEVEFRKFIAELNDTLPGHIILRATDDDGFTDRSLTGLRADIVETKADVVIVDPFYYLDYETNTSKTAGGDAAATSKKLRLMTGALGVLTIAITQADEDSSEKDSEGVREMKPPQRSEVRKTKALLEDAAALIGIDTLAHEGRGIIEIGKGRSGGEDTRIEIIYLPNYGIVREPNSVDVSAQFAGKF